MTQFAKERRILGIDPGTNILGYSVIEQRNKSVEILTMDVLVLGSKEEMNTKLEGYKAFINLFV
ncbi:MAG: crossover junction endodeoxyribonuclease RuvC [Bacteroidales bacterium]|nr:crossover junction endodeoxyribonuclease RuvC [Bacteroidales bacterium]